MIATVASLRFFFRNLYTDFHRVFLKTPIGERGVDRTCRPPSDYTSDNVNKKTSKID